MRRSNRVEPGLDAYHALGRGTGRPPAQQPLHGYAHERFHDLDAMDQHTLEICFRFGIRGYVAPDGRYRPHAGPTHEPPVETETFRARKPTDH